MTNTKILILIITSISLLMTIASTSATADSTNERRTIQASSSINSESHEIIQEKGFVFKSDVQLSCIKRDTGMASSSHEYSSNKPRYLSCY